MPTRASSLAGRGRRLLPCPNSPGFEHKENSIRLCTCGRFPCRLSMMSCCRKSAFSAMSSDLLLARSASVPSGKESVNGLATNKVSTEYVQRGSHESLEIEKNQFTECASPSGRYVDGNVVLATWVIRSENKLSRKNFCLLSPSA